MSQENVEIARQHHDAFNRRDIPAFLAALDPDVEWIPIMAALEGHVYRGHEAVQRWIEDLFRDWEFFEPMGEEFHDLGDRVLIFGRWRARGRVSGVELENQPATWLYEIQSGKIVWMRTFTDRGEALKAAGVKE
jgi:ketosteroid isomerase-like protein